MSVSDRDLLRLRRIAEHCRSVGERIERFGIGREAFVSDAALRDMLLTPVLQVGELGGKLGDEAREATLGQRRWREVRGFRNLFVHVYDRVDVEMAWDIVTQDVPRIGAEVEAYLEGLGDAPEPPSRPGGGASIVARAPRL